MGLHGDFVPNTYPFVMYRTWQWCLPAFTAKLGGGAYWVFELPPFLFLFRTSTNTRAINAITNTPPTAAPTTVPVDVLSVVDELDPPEELELPEEDDEEVAFRDGAGELLLKLAVEPGGGGVKGGGGALNSCERGGGLAGEDEEEGGEPFPEGGGDDVDELEAGGEAWDGEAEGDGGGEGGGKFEGGGDDGGGDEGSIDSAGGDGGGLDLAGGGGLALAAGGDAELGGGELGGEDEGGEVLLLGGGVWSVEGVELPGGEGTLSEFAANLWKSKLVEFDIEELVEFEFELEELVEFELDIISYSLSQCSPFRYTFFTPKSRNDPISSLPLS
ncbi:hypothetical protein CRG98_036969 [Punica granatum]|uniref:Uncharacterized protein n=1 Tax=Punica granatum TaxID=22663 RepID=A0A2I0IFD1_PUNGR|nr:hypothetical protein CRG98_036969 [Punica granatum]